MDLKTLTSYLKLLACDKVGVLNARKLLEYYEDANGIFEAMEDPFLDDLQIPIGIKTAIREFNQFECIEEELRFIEQNKIRHVGILENSYPRLLKECPDAPILLFYKGDLSILNNLTLSTVGARKMTDYGKEMVQFLLTNVQEFQPTIVSGMAHGIDITAYKEARKLNLPVVGVMGTSFKTLYPSAHKVFYNDLFNNGLVITEYAGFNKLSPQLFTRRNRIIAGLSQATVVVESTEKGGSLATALFANDYGREVYALPGKITDELSRGCLKLIQENRAQVLFNFNHLITDLNWEVSSKYNKKEELEKEFEWNDFSVEQQVVLRSLQKGILHIDELAAKTHLDISVLNAELMVLELKELVVSLSGKMFKVNNRFL